MADTEKPTIDAAPDKKQPHWWWHDDDYISNDTWNFLAIGEVVLAFCLYYWLASSSTWPWLTVLSFISVPLLLLRSETSIKRGLELLEKAWEDRNATKREIWLFRIISFIIVAGLCYLLTDYLSQQWLASRSGWTLFLGSAVIGAGTGSIAGVIAISIGGAAAGSGTGTGLGIGLRSIAAVVAGAVIVPVVVSGAGIVAATLTAAVAASAAIAVARAVSGATTTVGVIFWLPGYAIGLWLLGLRIRIRATVPNWRAGLAAFCHNWYETVLISNIRHAPALLPRAGKVRSFFNVSTMPKGNGSFWHLLVAVLLSIGITFVATIYRWNIKANSLIWAPLALLLRPIKWERHALTPELAPDSRRTDSAFWSERQMLYTLGVIFAILLAYLSYPHIPQDIQKQLPTWTEVFIKYVPPNLQSFRYWLAVLLLLTLSNQIFCTYKMHSSYKEQLAKSKEHQTMSADVEERFDSAAKQLVKSRWLTFACFLLLIYAIVFKYFLANWTVQAKHLVWDWLKPLL